MRITARVKKRDGALPWHVTVIYDGALHVCGARGTHAEALAHALAEVGLTPTNPEPMEAP